MDRETEIRVSSPTLKYGNYSLSVKKKSENTEIFLSCLFYFRNLNFLGEENNTVNRDLKRAFVETFRRAKNSNQTTFNNTLLPEENNIGAATIK